MCGIAGRALRTPTPGAGVRNPDSVLRSIRHRGPDALGQYVDDRVWFGHVRLSILDLSEAGAQPMSTDDGRYVICYNGEVYNFAELAASLQLDRLRSASDTEVVLHAFAKLGTASIGLLNGMFAFALYDREAQKIWLVRDRLGIKPLYYRLGGDSLEFASEIKALLAIDGHRPECDLSAVHEWLYYGTSLGERTLYRDVRKLLPGHYLELDLSSFEARVERYWAPPPRTAAGSYVGVEQRIAKTRELLEQAVKRQLVSDVPVGIFLSGGVDSSAITAYAARHYPGKLATYSAGFDFDKGVNELPRARAIAALYGTDHHEIRISGFEVADVVEKMVYHHDLPFSDAANIPLFLLSHEIDTKVVLQGDGGDEMFGGYSRYTTLSFYRTARALASIGGWANGLMPKNSGYYRRQRYIDALTANSTAASMALLLTEESLRSQPASVFSEEIRLRIVAADPFVRYFECQESFKDHDLVNQMLLTDATIILPDIFLEKVDRATMAASVEVRVPFLDNDLVDFCMQLRGSQKIRLGRKKWLLKKALEDIVPNEILYGRKTGFGVPYGHWLRGSLKPLFFDHLQVFRAKHPAILDMGVIKTLYDEHLSQRRDRSFLLWKMLNFLVWANRNDVDFA